MTTDPLLLCNRVIGKTHLSMPSRNIGDEALRKKAAWLELSLVVKLLFHHGADKLQDELGWYPFKEQDGEPNGYGRTISGIREKLAETYIEAGVAEGKITASWMIDSALQSIQSTISQEIFGIDPPQSAGR